MTDKIEIPEFKIDKGVPLQKHGGVGKIKTHYPWHDMQVGDSVGFPSLKRFRAASVSVYNHVRSNPPQMFKARSKPLRIWRVM